MAVSSGEILDRCPRCGELAECDKYWRLRGDRYCFLFRCWCTGDWRGAAWRRIMTLEEARARTERLLEEEEREMARAREEGRRRLEMARELEGRLCARCVFWEGGLCRATPRGRHSPCFKPEEGRCLDFVEVVAVAVRHDPVVWAKVGRAGGELRIMSAVACGPYRPLDRPVAATGRGVRFAPEETLELARALETRQSRGPVPAPPPGRSARPAP